MAAPPTASIWRSFILLIQLSLNHSINVVGNTALGFQQSHPIPLSSLHSGEELLFPECVSPNEMVRSESVLGIKPCDSGVVIR